MIEFYDLLGLIGVSLSLYCYARLQWHRNYAREVSYSLLNFIGSMLMFVSLMNHWNIAAFVSNAVWCGISLYGIYRCLKYMRRNKRSYRRRY